MEALNGIVRAYIEIDNHADAIKIFKPNAQSTLHAVLSQNIFDEEDGRRVKKGKKEVPLWRAEGYPFAEDYLIGKKQFIKVDMECSNLFLCSDDDKQIDKFARKIAKLMRANIVQNFKRSDLIFFKD